MRKKMISLMMTVAMGTVMISGATVVKADSDEKETVKLAVWSSGAARSEEHTSELQSPR